MRQNEWYNSGEISKLGAYEKPNLYNYNQQRSDMIEGSLKDRTDKIITRGFCWTQQFIELFITTVVATWRSHVAKTAIMHWHCTIAMG